MENAPMGILTKQDIIALNAAETVVFRHQGDEIGIDLKLFVKKGREKFETRHFITCKSDISNHAGYGSDASIRSKVYRYACHVVTSAKYDEVLQTVIAFLKEGDEVKMEWAADFFRNSYVNDARCLGNTNATMAGEGLHADAFRLQVTRKGKRFTFLVECQFCPDNSARMIRERREW